MNASSIQKPRPFRQDGYTLIEIMIALVVALFLLGGLGTLVAGTRRTGSNQTALAQLQDEQRLAMSILTDVIQNAGTFDSATYYTATNAWTTTKTVPANSAMSLVSGQAIVGTHSTTLPGDTLAVRYATNGSDNIMNCVGGSNPGTATTYINYFVINGSNQLTCSPTGNTSDAVVLVNNIANMQIYYGVVTVGGSMNSVDTYMTASQVTNWLNVASVRLTLGFVNPLASQPGQLPYVFFTRVIALQPRGGAVFP